ncbi:MAG: hypothetical protein ABI690_09930 [Chloroflexota bacterium]
MFKQMFHLSCPIYGILIELTHLIAGLFGSGRHPATANAATAKTDSAAQNYLLLITHHPLLVTFLYSNYGGSRAKSLPTATTTTATYAAIRRRRFRRCAQPFPHTMATMAKIRQPVLILRALPMTVPGTHNHNHNPDNNVLD